MRRIPRSEIWLVLMHMVLVWRRNLAFYADGHDRARFGAIHYKSMGI